MEGVTREALRPLLDLQQVDSTVDRLTGRRANLPEQQELDALAAERAAVAGTHAERAAALQEISSGQARLEGEVSMLEAKITQESVRLYGGEISNPKELTSIQAELDALRRRKAHVEDQFLDVLEQREGIDGEIRALTEQLAEVDQRIADASARRDAAAVEIEKELGELRARREELLPTIPVEGLEMYQDLRARKDGVAVAALQSGVCKGCNVALSPVALDEIRRSDDPIIRCENCRRMVIPV